MTALRTAFTPDHREWLVREILAAPQEERNMEVARRCGVSRETVRRVRFGTMWAAIAPELERQPMERAGAFCTSCRLFDHRLEACSQRYPEAFHDGGEANVRYAQQCPAFFPQEDDDREAMAQKVLELAADGASERAIAREVGCTRGFVRNTMLRQVA